VVEIRRGGIVRRWRGRSESRLWNEIQKIDEWSVSVKHREMPHLTVAFTDGVKWEFDVEYRDYDRLRAFLFARGVN